MQKFRNSLKTFADHPLTRLSVGLILFISGVLAAYESFESDLSGASLKVHHGILLLGIVNILSSLPDVIEGLSSAVDAHVDLAEKKKNPIK